MTERRPGSVVRIARLLEPPPDLRTEEIVGPNVDVPLQGPFERPIPCSRGSPNPTACCILRIPNYFLYRNQGD